MRVDECGRNGFTGRLAAPKDELEDWIEALALLDRGFGDCFCLFETEPVTIEDRRVTENDEARPGPHLEMSQPELLVDEAERLVDRSALLRGDLDVGKGQELETLVLRAPDAAKLVLRPTPGRRSNDLAFGRPLTRPAARLEILLEGLDRSAVVALVLNFFVAQDYASGLALGLPRFEPAAAAGPATFASNAAIRALRISFSSRAAAAMAFTASNSSRPTKSAPPIHSLNFSRAEASASRPMPAKVPAKPFTIFTKSSNILFSDCIGNPPFRRRNRELRRVPPP